MLYPVQIRGNWSPSFQYKITYYKNTSTAARTQSEELIRGGVDGLDHSRYRRGSEWTQYCVRVVRIKINELTHDQIWCIAIREETRQRGETILKTSPRGAASAWPNLAAVLKAVIFKDS